MGRNERNGVLIYRGNRGWGVTNWHGKRVFDDITGVYFEEDYATQDEFGDTVDSRNRSAYDYDSGATGAATPLTPPFYR